ncbi:MAG: response regulator [Bacteroidales bacterium]
MGEFAEKPIMLVDDSSVNNMLMQNILEEAGYSTLSFSDPHDALIHLRKQQPGLIILDIMMPGADGYEMLEYIKKSSETQGIPVIMLTARNNQRDRQRSFELGAIDYITKPIDIDDVLARVTEAMKN